MSTFTTFYNFTLPEVGGDPEIWATYLNGNWSSVDSILNSLEVGKASVGHTHALDALSDVVLTALADGEVLTYQGGVWVNAPPGGGGGGGVPEAPTDSLIYGRQNAAWVNLSLSYLPLAGGELTGFLTLHAAPTALMHAVNKAYADAIESDANAYTDAQLAAHVAAPDPHPGYVLSAGDVMTGLLTLSGAPVNPTHAATKAYVDSGDATAESNAQAYTDASMAAHVGALDPHTQYVQVNGDTMTGFLTLNALPVNALHAATKSYVDNTVAAGTVITGRWLWDDTAVIADPGIGEVRGDAATMAAMTTFAVSNTDADAVVYTFNLVNVGDTLIFANSVGGSTFGRYTITSKVQNAGWTQFGVIVNGSTSGNPGAGDSMVGLWVPLAAASTGVGEAPSTGSDYWRNNGAWVVGNWTSLDGKPATFPPDAHNHPVGEITGLNAAAIPSTATGSVAATNVQAAIAELAAEKANLASPILTGLPEAPTASIANNNTLIATTAFGHALMNNHTGAADPHPNYALEANAALTGIPTAPTAAPGTNTTQIATTAFDAASMAAHTGAADPHPGYALEASGAFTGTPTAPTAAANTATTQLATCAFVDTGFARLNRSNSWTVAQSAPDWTATSDTRLKQNVQPFLEYVPAVMNLQPVRFEWIDSGLRDIGFIAQDVQAHFPQAVVEEATGYLGISYNKIVTALVGCVQQQQRRIANLESRLSALEAAGG